MSNNDHKHDRTYELIDLDNLPTLANENDTHWIYFCPNCESKRGKPDLQGKMYFDKHEHKGFCHLCNTAFFPLIKEDDDNLPIDNKTKQIIDNFSKKIDIHDFKDPPAIGFNFNDLSDTDLKYLKSRHKFLPMLAPALGFKSWSGSKNGVVIPYLYKNYIATFQVRFETTDPKQRYYIPRGTEKILYSPQHLLTNFELQDEQGDITIVEGIFDSIAALVLGYPNPLSVQGSTLTDYQCILLRKFMPNNAFVMMDDIEKSENVVKDVKTKVPSIAKTQIISFGDDVDPEEHLKSQMKDPSKFKEYFNNTMQFIKERS